MASVTATLNDFPSTLSRAWVWGRRLLWTVGGVFGLVLVLEAIHLHRLLDGIHPVVAWTVTLALAGLLVYLGARAALRYLSVPRVIAPPDLPPPTEGWTVQQRRAYRDFAVRYLRRQQRNPHLAGEAVVRVTDALAALETVLQGEAEDPVRAARELVERVEKEVGAVLAPLDQTAKRLIRKTAVEVSIATAVSPSILLDSLITLSRNVNLIASLADLYYGRPGLFGTLRITRDVLGAAVAAGALEVVSDNLASAASEITGSWSARLLGPLGQGAVNGVVTMRLGAAARTRCRSLASPKVPWRPWRLSDYRRGMARLVDWMSEDVGPRFAQPLARWLGGSSAPDGDAPPDPDATPPRKRGLFGRLFGRGKVGSKVETAPSTSPADPLLDSDLLE